jgi:hypothetical protein
MVDGEAALVVDGVTFGSLLVDGKAAAAAAAAVAAAAAGRGGRAGWEWRHLRLAEEYRPGPTRAVTRPPSFP